MNKLTNVKGSGAQQPILPNMSPKIPALLPSHVMNSASSKPAAVPLIDEKGACSPGPQPLSNPMSNNLHELNNLLANNQQSYVLHSVSAPNRKNTNYSGTQHPNFPDVVPNSSNLPFTYSKYGGSEPMTCQIGVSPEAGMHSISNNPQDTKNTLSDNRRGPVARSATPLPIQRTCTPESIAAEIAALQKANSTNKSQHNRHTSTRPVSIPNKDSSFQGCNATPGKPPNSKRTDEQLISIASKFKNIQATTTKPGINSFSSTPQELKQARGPPKPQEKTLIDHFCSQAVLTLSAALKGKQMQGQAQISLEDHIKSIRNAWESGLATRKQLFESIAGFVGKSCPGSANIDLIKQFRLWYMRQYVLQSRNALDNEGKRRQQQIYQRQLQNTQFRQYIAQSKEPQGSRYGGLRDTANRNNTKDAVNIKSLPQGTTAGLFSKKLYDPAVRCPGDHNGSKRCSRTKNIVGGNGLASTASRTGFKADFVRNLPGRTKATRMLAKESQRTALNISAESPPRNPGQAMANKNLVFPRPSQARSGPSVGQTGGCGKRPRDEEVSPASVLTAKKSRNTQEGKKRSMTKKGSAEKNGSLPPVRTDVPVELRSAGQNVLHGIPETREANGPGSHVTPVGIVAPPVERFRPVQDEFDVCNNILDLEMEMDALRRDAGRGVGELCEDEDVDSDMVLNQTRLRTKMHYICIGHGINQGIPKGVLEMMSLAAEERLRTCLHRIVKAAAIRMETNELCLQIKPVGLSQQEIVKNMEEAEEVERNSPARGQNETGVVGKATLSLRDCLFSAESYPEMKRGTLLYKWYTRLNG